MAHDDCRQYSENRRVIGHQAGSGRAETPERIFHTKSASYAMTETLICAWIEFLIDLGWITKVEYSDHERMREKFAVTEEGQVFLQKYG